MNILSMIQWRSQNAEKQYAHQREITVSSNDSLQLLFFSKWELLLLEQFLKVKKITFTILGECYYFYYAHAYNANGSYANACYTTTMSSIPGQVKTFSLLVVVCIIRDYTVCSNDHTRRVLTLFIIQLMSSILL